jgi:hypothetical protein
MKSQKILPFIIICFLPDILYSQDINWSNSDTASSHLIALKTGADFCSYYGISYNYRIKGAPIPVAAGSEFLPSFGSTIFDDWKLRTAIQAELWHRNSLSWALQTGFIIRRTESELARLVNFGTDIITVFGYSKPVWGAGLVVGYDWSISTKIKNDLLKEYFPDVIDGWYKTRGGSFRFGTRINYSIKRINLFLNIGKIYERNFKGGPTLPFYFDISIQKQF